MSLGPRVAVALALVVAGCSGLTGGPAEGGATTETLTPAPVPDPDRQTTVEGRVAPGLTDERLVDQSALLAAHGAALSGNSHTYRERVTRHYTNGTVQRRGTSVVRQDGTATFYRFDSGAAGGQSTAVERWSNGSVTYTRRTGANGSTYEAVGGEGIGLDADDYTGSLTRLFAVVTVRTNGTTTRHGREVYRIETPEPEAVPPLENVTFVGHVTSAGVVTDYRVQYTVRRPPTPVEVTVDVAVSDLGATQVERPPWYGRAVNATG